MRNQAQVKWDNDIMEYLSDLQCRRLPFLNGILPIFTEHHRDKQIFRGSPNYRDGRYWYDWVGVNYGEAEPTPCQIWCFVDLRAIPAGVTVQIDGVSVEKGVFAVVESAEYVPKITDPAHPDFGMISSLVSPCTKQAKVWEDETQGKIGTRAFFLADVEAFVEPLTVYPDIGANHKARYLVVKPKNQWADDFQAWLRTPYAHDLMKDEKEALRRYIIDPAGGFNDYLDVDDESDEDDSSQPEEDELQEDSDGTGPETVSESESED